MEKEMITYKVKGIITAAFRGSTKFSKTDMLRLSLKFDEGERDKLAEACKDAYKDVSDGFKPNWFKDAKAEYINLKSNFDIPVIYGDGFKSSLEDILADVGSINGSKAIVVVNIKDGAVYPLAIKITELITFDFESFFDE